MSAYPIGARVRLAACEGEPEEDATIVTASSGDGAYVVRVDGKPGLREVGPEQIRGILRRRYRGQRREDDGETIVLVDTLLGEDQALVSSHQLPLRLELMGHSPTGFEWGYRGSGPAQLALAIVADALNLPPGTRGPRLFDDDADPTIALARRVVGAYQQFKEDHVARWDGPTWWLLDEDVLRAVERIERRS